VPEQLNDPGGTRETKDAGESTFDLSARLAGMTRPVPSGPAPTGAVFGQRPTPMTAPEPDPAVATQPATAIQSPAVPEATAPPSAVAPSTAAARVGRLSHVSASELWPTRAALAGWVAEDPSILGDAIGTTLASADHGAAPNRVVATTADGTRVSVVCEVTPTSDEGLAAVLEIAALGTASTIAWVAASAQANHMASLSWLNGRGDARFFLVTVKGARIGDSAAAAVMDLVVRPPRAEGTDGEPGADAVDSGRRADDHERGS
jgi:hypothetical protein